MDSVAFIADERQIGVVGSVVKRRLLVRVPTAGDVTTETKAVAERKAHVIRFLKGTHEVRHCITRCLGFYQQLVFDGGTVVAIYTFKGFRLCSHIMRGCQRRDPSLDREKCRELLLMQTLALAQVAGDAKLVVLLKTIGDGDPGRKDSNCAN